MAKNNHTAAVRSRCEFKHNGTWFKHDTNTGRIVNGSLDENKGVRNER